MDNYFATTMQPQKKKADVFAMVVGAILALGFFVSFVLQIVVFFIDWDYYRDLFEVAFRYGFDFDHFMNAITEFLASLMIIVGAFLLFIYSALALILKGKKIRALFIISFVLNMFALSGVLVFLIVTLFPEVVHMLASPENYVMDFGALIIYLTFWCVTGFFGVICGIFKKKVPSIIFGVLGAISAVLTLVFYIAFRSLFVFGFSFREIMYITSNSLTLLSMAGVLLFLRPTKKQ